jgi:hypothetical protein
MDNNFVPDLYNYLIAHVVEEHECLLAYENAVADLTMNEAENYWSTPNLPPSST